MPTPTDNHGFEVDYADGENWDYNQEFQTLEETVPVRDLESNRSNYTPYAGAKFEATDTGARYTGDGTSWNKAPAEFESVNSNYVYDTSGRYHGELTGTGDAQVVLDAIADRQTGTSVVLPDPGFALDWEQQVDLPPEDEFGLITVGRPELSCGNNTGNHALNIPAPSTGTRARHMQIGSVRISSAGSLATNWGISADNVGNSLIDRSNCIGCGIRIQSPDGTAAHNVINQPRVYNPSGAGIKLANNQPSGGGRTNANVVFAPQYLDGNNFTQTAFIDEADGNRWYAVDVESAEIAFLADGANGYYVDFDYIDEDFPHSVVERNGAKGEIHTSVTQKDWRRLRLQSAATEVLNRLGRNPTIDYLEDARAAFPGAALSNFGLSDDSTGGASASVGSLNTYGRPHYELSTGTTSGDAAVLTHQAPVLTGSFHPRIFGNVTVPTGSAISTSCVFRFGLYQNSDNYAEVIYDPSVSGNWQFEVRTNATTRNTVDTGITAQNGTSDFALNYDDSGTWYCDINNQQAAEIADGGSQVHGNVRWYLETTDTSAENWRIRTDRALKFLVE